MTEQKRSSEVPAWLTALLVAILVGLIGVGVWSLSQPEAAQANPLTAVRHGGSLSGAPPYITLVKDNGTYVSLSRTGQTIWGVKAIRVENGTCIRVNGAAPRCATSGAFNIALGISSYVVERTK